MSVDLSRVVDFLPNLPGSRPRARATPKPKPSFFKKFAGSSFVKEKPQFHVPDLVRNNSATSLNLAPPLEKRRVKETRFIATFTAYFRESVNDSPNENNRLRLCNINYYFEDDSLEIFEPRVENSAIPQGKFLRRHKVPKDDDGNFLGWKDLYIGRELTVYTRTFRIVDANGSTRRYFQDVLHTELGPAEGLPWDSYNEAKKVQMSRETGRDPTVSHHILKNPMTGFHEAKLGKMIDHSARAGFLKYNRQVLRFHAVWDDRSRLYGDLLIFRIHYFLADDTIEVASVHGRNSGRDPFPLLLKRGKILKDEANYYHWTDMAIGAGIQIYSRALLIIDADPFTRRFFESRNAPLGEPITLPDEELPHYQREIPPHTGYGSEEDSLTSCPGHSLVISRPRIVRDVREDRVLSYKALLVSDRPEDEGREFTVTYYTLDNTISIYEPPKRNSGIIGGKFLSRREIKDINNENMPRDHFYVGNTVNLYAHEFLIVSADEPTMRFMERHPDRFPFSFIRGVMDMYAGQLRGPVASGELLATFQKHDAQGTGRVSLEGLRAVLEAYKLTPKHGGQAEQALLTVMRYMGKDGQLEYARFIDYIVEPEDYKLYASATET